MNSKNNLGLIPKTNTSQNGEQYKVISIKLRVEPEFHTRWVRAMQQVSRHYSGGASAVVLNAIKERLPEIEALAAAVGQSVAVSKGTGARKGGVS